MLDKMLTERDILTTLDDSIKQGYYCSFIDLGHPYSYLIDCRLNIFSHEDGRWAIVGERLGYNPRAGAILLDIHYFGNCLINLEHYNGQNTNYYTVLPIEEGSFDETIELESLKPGAKHWIVRGAKVDLSYNKQDYYAAGIELKEYEPNEISAEEVGRMAVEQHRKLFRAMDEELYKSIPKDLKKMLAIDEWYHRDYTEVVNPEISDEQLRQTYELNKSWTGEQAFMDYESFEALFRENEQRTKEYNQHQWQDNRPSSYETWQQIAKVIVTGDTSHYKPTIEPNTHWKYWPDSGSL